MRILITGAAGFLGFCSAVSLLKKGHIIYGIDSFDNYYSIKKKKKRIKELKAGLDKNLETTKKKLKRVKKIVFTSIEKDIESLEGLRCFLSELSSTGMRYFLEVFNPQIDIDISEDKLSEYINDCIVRCLAGLTRQDSPLFLKIPFNGPRAMEDLCSYHQGELIIGVLGGGKGTIRDTFELVRQSEKYGARVALFGRKINLAESPVTLVSLMRSVIEGELSSLNAVKEYHSSLSKENITPKLSFEKDQIVTEKVLFEDL